MLAAEGGVGVGVVTVVNADESTVGIGDQDLGDVAGVQAAGQITDFLVCPDGGRACPHGVLGERASQTVRRADRLAVGKVLQTRRVLTASAGSGLKATLGLLQAPRGDRRFRPRPSLR